MDEAAIAKYITDTFAHVETASNFGYMFFFYGTDRKLPFATIAAADNEYDCTSNLDRPGVFRLNIGVSRETFRSLFGTRQVDINAYDLTALNKVMPHPDYAAQHYVCVLNPSGTTFEHVQSLLAEAFDLAVQRHKKRQA
jgi:hypothetical protein